jgi:MFS family permease
VSWNFVSFALFRALTGFGIGGEYAAINSAIDELIPARLRGRTDIVVNGSFWLGAALGSGASLLFLDPAILPTNIGWRLGFAVGGILGLGILLLRRHVPESPRRSPMGQTGFSRRSAKSNSSIGNRRPGLPTEHRLSVKTSQTNSELQDDINIERQDGTIPARLHLPSARSCMIVETDLRSSRCFYA